MGTDAVTWGVSRTFFVILHVVPIPLVTLFIRWGYSSGEASEATPVVCESAPAGFFDVGGLGVVLGVGIGGWGWGGDVVSGF